LDEGNHTSVSNQLSFPDWRATYKAIPGRIIITDGMLQFRTSRVAGARVLVDYDTDDIVRIRKTKSIDLMLWHTNGLSLDMVDGEVSFISYFN
jgi:hypothetical protein